MSTIVNPFKVNKLANSITTRNKSTSILDTSTISTITQAVKLPALRAINKSVKHNNISFATTKDLNKLRNQPQPVDNIQQYSAHQSLYLIRKKFDNLYQQKQELQRQIEHVAAKRDKIMNEKLKYENQKAQGAIKVVELDQHLKQSKWHNDEADAEKKVMLHIVDRLKQDKIVYDVRIFNCEKELAYLKKQKLIILKQKGEKMGQGDRVKKIYQKLTHHFQQQQKQRQEHLQNFNDIINTKESVYEHEEDRHADIVVLRQNAMQDKLPTEKNWYKLMLATKFVSILLRDKISRQMNKFNNVQLAYKNIKTQTGITNCETFVSKFLSKQTTYGEYLGKISINQKHISKLKQEQSLLLKQRYLLQNQQEIILSNKKKMINLTRQQKEMHEYDRKSVNCFMLRQKLKNMIEKYNKKMVKIDNNKQKQSKDDNNYHTKLKSLFERIVKMLAEVDNIQINDKFQQNIIRMRSNTRISYEDDQIILNNGNGRNQSEVYEDQFLNNQRQSVLRNNDRFMKQLKKKYDDIKKMKMDAQPKKKEVVVEKPKVQVEVKEQEL